MAGISSSSYLQQLPDELVTEVAKNLSGTEALVRAHSAFRPAIDDVRCDSDKAKEVYRRVLSLRDGVKDVQQAVKGQRSLYDQTPQKLMIETLAREWVKGAIAMLGEIPDLKGTATEQKKQIEEWVKQNPDALGRIGELDISKKELRKLPEGIVLPGLFEINAKNNRLNRLPNDLANYSRLDTLLLGGNCFQCVPEEIGKIENLGHLDFSRMKTSKPLELGDHSPLWRAKGLWSLDLAKNEIETLSPQIQELSGLTELYLDCNELRDLPEIFSTLSRLVELDLSQNHFAEVPRCLYSMPNLEHLYLEDNALLEIASVQNYVEEIALRRPSCLQLYLDLDLEEVLTRATIPDNVSMTIKRYENGEKKLKLLVTLRDRAGLDRTLSLPMNPEERGSPSPVDPAVETDAPN